LLLLLYIHIVRRMIQTPIRNSKRGISAANHYDKVDTNEVCK